MKKKKKYIKRRHNIKKESKNRQKREESYLFYISPSSSYHLARTFLFFLLLLFICWMEFTKETNKQFTKKRLLVLIDKNFGLLSEVAQLKKDIADSDIRSSSSWTWCVKEEPIKRFVLLHPPHKFYVFFFFLLSALCSSSLKSRLCTIYHHSIIATVKK